MSINFKAIKRQKLLDRLSRKMPAVANSHLIASDLIVEAAKRDIIKEYIDNADFYILANHDDEFIGGLASELKDILDEKSNILLVTTNEDEARRLFEEYEGEEVFEGEIPEKTEAAAKPVQAKNAEEIRTKVKEIIEKYFPNGKLTINKGALGGESSQFFDFSYGKEIDDFPNKIRLNDIMYTSFYIMGFDDNGDVIGKLSLGETGHSTRGLRINGSKVASFNWKNITMNPNKILERLDSYFKEAREFIDSSEGQKILEAYNKTI